MAVAQHTAMVSPRDSRSCACPARTPKGTGERCTLAHIDSKKRRYACNEIKLLVRSSALTEPPVTGTLALQNVRRRSQNNEEDC